MSFANRNLKQEAAARSMERLVKSAGIGGAVARMIGLGAVRSLGHTSRAFGRAIQSASKHLGASGEKVGFGGKFNAGWRFTGQNADLHRGWGNKLGRVGQSLVDFNRSLNANFANKWYSELGDIGKGWQTAARWGLKGGGAYFKYGWIPGFAADFGAPVPDWMATVSRPSQYTFEYATPGGLAWTGASYAIPWAANKGINFVADVAGNAAYDASQETAARLAQELAGVNSMQYMGGAFNQGAFANAVHQRAVDTINETFPERMKAYGLENWRPGNYVSRGDIPDWSKYISN